MSHVSRSNPRKLWDRVSILGSNMSETFIGYSSNYLTFLKCTFPAKRKSLPSSSNLTWLLHRKTAKKIKLQCIKCFGAQGSIDSSKIQNGLQVLKLEFQRGIKKHKREKRKWQDLHGHSAKTTIIQLQQFQIIEKWESKRPTSNVTVERTPLCAVEVLWFGIEAWIIQANELNWFKLDESPTNIIFFPLYFCRKFKALNLHKKFKKTPWHSNTKKWIIYNWFDVSKVSTLARHKKMAAIYISHIANQGDHAFGSWTGYQGRDMNKDYREDTKSHKPIFHWTNYICHLRAFCL